MRVWGAGGAPNGHLRAHMGGNWGAKWSPWSIFWHPSFKLDFRSTFGLLCSVTWASLAGCAVPAEGGASPPSLPGPCEFKPPFYTPLSPLDEVRRIASAPRSPPDPLGFLSDSVCSPCCGLHPCAVIWDRSLSWCLKGSAIFVHLCCHLLCSV